MAPPRSTAAPPDLPIPYPTAVDEFNLHLLHAASEGDLPLLKGLVRALEKSTRDPREVLDATREEGLGALHMAARIGSVPVCRYLVEEIGVDVDADGDESSCWYFTAIFLPSANHLPVGFPFHLFVLHSGDREMVELLLTKGASVDSVSVSGTPLHIAAFRGQDEAMKVLLENNADHNKILPGIDTPLISAITASSVKCVKLLVEAGADVNDGLVPPLAAAADKGLTACLKCLLEAGADPNVPDPSGRLPIELAALNGTREDVEILFPVTSCIPTVHDWSIDGIILHAKSVSMEQGDYSNVKRIDELKSLGVKSVKRNDYSTAATVYSVAIEHDPHDATLFSNRSLCWLRMGDGHNALQDALACREMRPGWPKACYRQGAALMLLKDYGGARDAFLDAAKLDPQSSEIKAALREAMNSLEISDGATKTT
ncbi:Ankyrin repeat and SOCS box protein 3 [Triticum urartu]|uniref:Ankyrin repeat and SOCS box protein 3 n=1 Tax=Triticum urartu TaxID=4572 RepID=M8AKV7_TRIUA|nr:Ankyrin repeat and SOCS box protein 3 [Triticum urartu]